jgi:hypothetical protein
MADREIRKCSKCGHYSFGLSRCLLGKINPPTIKGGVDAVSFMGFSYICGYAKHYDKIKAELVKRMQKQSEQIKEV